MSAIDGLPISTARSRKVEVPVPESRGAAYVVQKAEERHIGLIELWALDTRGRLQVLTVLRPELESILELGLPFASRRISTAADETWVLVADPLTFATLPRIGHDALVARLACDLQTPDGAPVTRCARTILKRQLGRAKALGYSAYLSAGLDTRFVESSAGGSAYQPLGRSRARVLARDAALRAESLGIGLAGFSLDAESGLWTYELSAVDPLSLADALVSLRRVLGDTAAAADAHATFMARPWTDAARASLALTLTLVEGYATSPAGSDVERRAPTDPDRAFAARIARDLGALELVARPTVNGRQTPGAMSAEPVFSADGGTAVRMRGGDANANPYLYLALALGAAFDATVEVERDAQVPEGALAIRSPLLGDVLGAELLAELSALADADTRAWQAQVTALDLDLDRTR
jgi:glutamine synthetase